MSHIAIQSPTNVINFAKQTEEVVHTGGISIPDLAAILEEVQKIDCFSRYEICLAGKTSGGVSVTDRETGREIHIIRGLNAEEWPYISDRSLAKVKSSENLCNFFSNDFQVNAMARCDDLDVELRKLADIVLHFFSTREQACSHQSAGGNSLP